MQHVHQVRVSDRAPERLTFAVAGSDLDLDSGNATIAHPGLRFLDEQTSDTLPAHFGSNPEVGDFRAFGLLENRRRAIDAHDTQTLWRPVPVVDEDLCIGIAMQRAQQFAQLAVGNRAATHSEEWIEGGVMFGDQRPERGNPIDLTQLCDPDSPTSLLILLAHLALDHPPFAVACPARAEASEKFFRMRGGWLHSPGSLERHEPCRGADDRPVRIREADLIQELEPRAALRGGTASENLLLARG